MITSGGREAGRSKIGVGNWKVQIITCKLSYKDILYNTEIAANIL